MNFFPFPTYATSTYDRNFYMEMIARVLQIFWYINQRKCHFSTKKFSKKKILGPYIFTVRGSLYFKWSMDPFIFNGPWIPEFWPVHGSLYSERSMDPYIFYGPWIPIFLTVLGFLYFLRSVDPYILTGPWIPILRTVRGSLFFKGRTPVRSVDLWFRVNMTHIIFETHSILMLTTFS